MATKASPRPTDKVLEQVDFGTAMEAVVNGKKATKLEWGNPEEYIFLRATILHIRRETPDGTEHVWRVSDGDVRGTDWVILG